MKYSCPTLKFLYYTKVTMTAAHKDKIKSKIALYKLPLSSSRLLLLLTTPFAACDDSSGGGGCIR